MRKAAPVALTTLALFVACQILNPSVVPEETWNRAKPSVVKMLEQTQVYEGGEVGEITEITALITEITAIKGDLPNSYYLDLDTRVSPWRVKHLDHVTADTSIHEISQRVRLELNKGVEEWFADIRKRGEE